MPLPTHPPGETDAPVVELKNLSVQDAWGSSLLADLQVTFPPGAAVHLIADRASDAHLFMRCLATLDWPQSGTYRFAGETLPFSDYQRLLPVKRRIGYLYPMAAMVRNRTVEENLDYQAHYFSDTDLVRHQGLKAELAAGFGIERALSSYPERVSAMEQRQAIAVRALLKEPLLLLAEQPEEFVGRGYLSLFVDEIRKLLARGGVFVYTTNYRGFGKELNPMILRLENGTLFEELTP